MALLQCPECGRQVSDRAPACPQCGLPIRKQVEGEPRPRKRAKSEARPSNKGLIIGLSVGGGVLAVGLIVLIILLLRPARDKTTDRDQAADRGKTADTVSKKTAKNPIVGKWESNRSHTTFEFTQDGRFIHVVLRDGTRDSGSYVVLDETHMEMTTDGEPGTGKITFSVSETELNVFNTETSSKDTFKRVY